MDYTTIPNQLMEFQKAQAAAMNSLRETMFGAIEKTLQLNAKAAEALFVDGIEATQALVGAKSGQDVASLWNAAPAWTLDKLTGYSQNAYRIFNAASAEVLKLVEAQLGQTSRQTSEFADSSGQASSLGPVPVATLFKGMLSATQAVIEAELRVAKQAAEWGVSSFASLANAAATSSKGRAIEETKAAASRAATA